MDPKFWFSAWKEGRTGFHRKDFNDKLLEFFPLLQATEGQSILVPLCGKTKDVFWLHQQGLKVRGIELSEEAVKEFFKDSGIPLPVAVEDEWYDNYRFENIQISVGDFFSLTEEETFDMVYDRAAMVALTKDLRLPYVEVLKRALKKGGRILLVTYEFNENELKSPPFSVTEQEIRDLYGPDYDIRHVLSQRPQKESPRLLESPSIKLNVHIITKS
jgi:thiopurine S-methyltransferase